MRPERRDDAVFGTNPCGEIVLRPYGLCNLSIAVARSGDSVHDIEHKVRVATTIGCIQSLITNFPGMRSEWKRNCEEERLIGVDITGQMDSIESRGISNKSYLRTAVLTTASDISKRLGINMPAACTTVKPSGNSSQLLDCSSGLHARWAPYYIRNVRVSAFSPIYKVLHDAGAPMNPENGQAEDTADTFVVHFPVKSPEGAITRNDMDAIAQCENWRINKLYWTEHNPSVTITYKPDEIIDLVHWVGENRGIIGGMAFLPSFDAQYDQLPYIEISKEEYEIAVEKFPVIDWSKIYQYELSDMSNAASELACMSGLCEL